MEVLLKKIQAEIDVFIKESTAQAEKGNKAAGTRARKAALELSKLMKEFRKVSIEEAKK
jgi:riboflavin synthase